MVRRNSTDYKNYYLHLYRVIENTPPEKVISTRIGANERFVVDTRTVGLEGGMVIYPNAVVRLDFDGDSGDRNSLL